MRHVMRLLRRHYGKLAAALLLAAALYVVWWALPVRPRVALLLPKGTGSVGLSADGGYYLTNCGPVGLSADGRYFLTHSGEQDFGAHDDPNGFRSRCDLIGPLRLWDTSNGQLAATVADIGGSLRGVEIAPHGRSLALVVGENPVILRVIESFTGREIGNFQVADEEPPNPPEVRFAPDGQSLAVETSSKGKRAITIWDMKAQQIRSVLLGQYPPLVFSPDGQTLATMNQDRNRQEFRTKPFAVSVWDVGSCRCRMEFPVDVSTGGFLLAFDRDGKTLGMLENRLIAWDLATGAVCCSREFGNPHWFQRDVAQSWRNWFFADGGDGEISLSEIATGKTLHLQSSGVVEGLDYATLHVCEFSRNKDSQSSVLSIMHWPHQPASQTCKWLTDWLSFAGMHLDSGDARIGFWDLRTGRHLSSIWGDYQRLFFSRDGDVMAAMKLRDTNGDQRLEIWDIPPRKPLGWFLTLAGLLLLLTLGGFWWQTRRRKRQAALATEAIPCGK